MTNVLDVTYFDCDDIKKILIEKYKNQDFDDTR